MFNVYKEALHDKIKHTKAFKETIYSTFYLNFGEVQRLSWFTERLPKIKINQKLV